MNTDKYIWRAVIFILGTFIVAGFLVPLIRLQTDERPNEGSTTLPYSLYANETYRFEFVYPPSYEILEDFELRGEERLKFLLADTDSLSSREDAFGISVLVLEDTEGLSTREWVMQFPQSNFDQGDGFFTTTHIGAQDALRYRWRDEHEAETGAVVYNGYIYIFTLYLPAIGAEEREVFERLLNSVVFLD